MPFQTSPASDHHTSVDGRRSTAGAGAEAGSGSAGVAAVTLLPLERPLPALAGTTTGEGDLRRSGDELSPSVGAAGAPALQLLASAGEPIDLFFGCVLFDLFLVDEDEDPPSASAAGVPAGAPEAEEAGGGSHEVSSVTVLW